MGPLPDPGQTEAACLRALTSANIAYERVDPQQAPGVAYPIRLASPVDGITITGGRHNAKTNYLDCRLAQALLAWAPTLREAGIVGIEHYSMYRKQARVAGSTKRSGHAGGMAIDAGRFELADGSVIDVLDDWSDRKRGADPCKARTGQPRAARLMRSVVCRAAELNLFQTIVTPHHNRAHRNHVHLEVSGPDTPQWIH